MEKIALLCILMAGVLAASSRVGIAWGRFHRFRSRFQQTRDAPPKPKPAYGRVVYSSSTHHGRVWLGYKKQANARAS